MVVLGAKDRDKNITEIQYEVSEVTDFFFVIISTLILINVELEER